MTQSPPDQPETPSPAGLTVAQFRWLMAGLILGLFLSSTEQSVVATALPTIAGELGGTERLAWVVTAYLLTSTIVTPLYGKMSDLYGRRIVYQTSITVFMIGSAACAIAPTMNTLVAARALQGLGGGGLMSLAFVIVGDVVSPRDRGRYMGIFTAVFAVSAVMGPLWGGLLVDTIGWRWIFLSVVPLAAAALVVTNRGLRLPFTVRPRPIDWLGIALLVVAAAGLILVPLWGGETYPWGSWQIGITAAVGVIGSAAFLIQESRAEEPVIPLRLFRDRSVVLVYVMGFGIMVMIVSVSTFLPLFLQVATGVSATQSGLEMTPQTIGMSLMAAGGGALVSRTGRYKWSLVLGPVVALVAVLGLTRIGPTTGALQLAPILFVLGCGLGMTFPNLTLAVQNAVPVEDMGIGTSTSNFFRSMGGAFGAAGSGALLTPALSNGLDKRLGPDRVAELGGASGLVRSPEVVRDLPTDLHDAVVESVADAVVSVFWWGVLIMLIVLACGSMVSERTLRTTASISGPSSAGTAEPGGSLPGGTGTAGLGPIVHTENDGEGQRRGRNRGGQEHRRQA
ncbi:MAG: MDR family MFS transporter [Acidimicrobiales bacterium]